MMWLMIIGGLVGLILGGEFLVRGSVALARRIGVSDLFIGAVLVGFGTSAPELVASLNAVSADSPGIAVGNVLGSNIANILLVLGTAAVIYPIATNPKALARDGVFAIAATLVLAALIYFNGFASRLTGIALFLTLVGIIIYSFYSDRKQGGHSDTAELHRDEAEIMDAHVPLLLAIPMAIGGLLGIVLGAKFLIDGSVQLARMVGLSETVIGITIIAIGTSLPELVTCVMAALKKKPDVALGNVLGSNTFNVFGILGITSGVMPFNVPLDQISVSRDLGGLILSMFFLVLFAFTGRKLARWEGGVLLLGYCVYIYLLLMGPA
ncbi:MAG: sodium:calcium antiporter [Ponticaulis sp.]|nr:sodium:calcium antiporter [Ponticaulis sp.]MBN04321.1 sodium:calcium antiporter [Ponticaulis sp.]